MIFHLNCENLRCCLTKAVVIIYLLGVSAIAFGVECCCFFVERDFGASCVLFDTTWAEETRRTGGWGHRLCSSRRFLQWNSLFLVNSSKCPCSTVFCIRTIHSAHDTFIFKNIFLLIILCLVHFSNFIYFSKVWLNQIWIFPLP